MDNQMGKIMLPNNNFLNENIIKMKTGANSDFSSILNNVSQEGLILVLPEMQQLFDMNQIKYNM
jgi:hypothetical protein